MGTLWSLSESAASWGLGVSEVIVLVSGLLLAVGLVGEYAESQRWKVWQRTFKMMVILGVAGELLGDAGIFLFSRRLQTIAAAELTRMMHDTAILNKEAGDAREVAGKADERAGKAEERAGKANERAGKANQRAGEANKRAQELAKRAEELKQQNLATEARLTLASQKIEEERNTRLELEKSLAPRQLAMRTDDKGIWNFEPLKQFAGLKVKLQYLPDAEVTKGQQGRWLTL